MTVTADATVPGSLGSFGWDDEGVPAQRDYLVTRGHAHRLPDARARPRRVDRAHQQRLHARRRLEPHPAHPHDHRLARAGRRGTSTTSSPTPSDGLYVETNNSWSIDDKRLNFQFACEIGWEIENGELGRMVKNAQLHRHHAAVLGRAATRSARATHWQVWGLPNCGKGEPMQVAHVAHGAAPARFRDVQVGVGR